MFLRFSAFSETENAYFIKRNTISQDTEAVFDHNYYCDN